MVLLHNLQDSSKSLCDLMKELAADFTVIAPDLPGYGWSDRLTGDQHLNRLADATIDFFHALNLDKPVLVALDTSAVIAARIARRHKDKISIAICNDVKLGESDSSLPILPTSDASYLVGMWQNIKDELGDTLKTQDRLLEQLMAGGIYSETLKCLSGFDAIDGLSHIANEDFTAKLITLAKRGNPVKSPKHVETMPIAGDSFTKVFVDVIDRDIMVYGRAGMTNEALLGVHALGRSTKSILPALKSVPKAMTVVSADLPCCGASADALSYTIDEFQDFLSAMLADLPSRTAIYSDGLMGALIMEAINKAGLKPTGLILNQPLILDDDSMAQAIAHLTPNLTPSSYGEHLVTVWGRIRDSKLAANQALDPDDLHQEIIDTLCADGNHYGLMTEALGKCHIDYFTALMQAVDYPVIFLSDPDHPLAGDIAKLAKVTRKGFFIEDMGVSGLQAALNGLGLGT